MVIIRSFYLLIAALMLSGLLAGCDTAPTAGATPTSTPTLKASRTPPPTDTPEPTPTPLPPVDDTSPLRAVSLTGDGRPGAAHLGGVSDDGQYVIFGTFPESFPEGGPWLYGNSSVYQIFLRDTVKNTTLLVTTGADGRPSDHMSFGPAISGDANTVAYFREAASAGQTCPASSGGECYSLVVFETHSGQTEHILDTRFTYGSLAISADGSRIAIATFTDPNQIDLSLLDRATGARTTISQGDGLEETRYGSHVPIDISADGRVVVFATYERLAPDDHNDVADVYLFDAASGQIERVSRRAGTADPGQPSGLRPQATSGMLEGLAISPDGRYVVFMSEAALVDAPLTPEPGLTPCDPIQVGESTPACRHIYLFDRQTGAIELVSVSDDGTPANQASYQPDISADGRWVVFSSWATNLVPGIEAITCDDFPDMHGKICPQIYARDRETGKTYLISRGLGGALPDGRSVGPKITPDGRFVLFASGADNLVTGVELGVAREVIFLADLERVIAGGR